MRLRSGLICDHSLGERFLAAWTSSLAATPASPSAQPASDSEQTTSDTSGLQSQMELGFSDPDSVSLKTSRGTSRWDSPQSSATWKNWVTKCRGAYSARLKSAHRTSANECSSWPTAKARDWKDTTGCSLDAVNPDGTHRNRRDRLVGAIVAEMHGLAAQASSSSGGSRQELWPTPRSGKLNPRWVETLMGLPVGWILQSCLRPIALPASAAENPSAQNATTIMQTVHALGQIATMSDNRTDELRMLGNGVVPATAAKAFETLMKELL